MTIKLTGTINIPLEQHETLIPLLSRHVLESRKEPGNIRFEIAQDEEDPEIFHLDEEFTDEEAFEFHQKRGAASPWGEQSKDLKRDFEKSGDWSLFEEDD